MLSRNSLKIFPSVIENCFLEDPQVTACAVVRKNREGRQFPWPMWCPAGKPIPELEQALGPRPKTLNTYLIPAAYHFPAELPLTPEELDYRTLETWAGTGGASIKPVLLVEWRIAQKAAAQRAAAFCGMEAGSSS